MTRKMTPQRARTLRIAGAVSAGALVFGMVTVGAAVAADTGSSDVRQSVTAPGAKKSREARPVADAKNPKKSREAPPVHDAKGPKKSREAAPRS